MYDGLYMLADFSLVYLLVSPFAFLLFLLVSFLVGFLFVFLVFFLAVFLVGFLGFFLAVFLVVFVVLFFFLLDVSIPHQLVYIFISLFGLWLLFFFLSVGSCPLCCIIPALRFSDKCVRLLKHGLMDILYHLTRIEVLQ